MLLAAAVLGDHPLGRPIGGTPETIRAVPRDAVQAHYEEHYQPATLVVTAAGGVDHDALCAQVLREPRQRVRAGPHARGGEGGLNRLPQRAPFLGVAGQRRT